MAMEMPPPSPRTNEKRRLPRGTPTSRSFFSSGSDVSRTPADVSWLREQAGTTPRALDRDFLAASPAAAAAAAAGAADVAPKAAPALVAPVKSKMYNRRTWTKEENDQLQEGIAALGGPNADLGRPEWNMIAEQFLKNSRTGTQCATHWRMVLKPALLKGVWSPEEDAVIYDCIARGIHDWSEVATYLPKRKPKHCRERWNKHLDPTLSTNGHWSPTEEAKLLSAVEAHGTNWNMVARQLPGRSEPVVQQHWNAIVLRNAVNSAGPKRGRRKGDTAAGIRGRAKPSLLPVEPGLQSAAVKDEGESGGGQGGNGGGGTRSSNNSSSSGSSVLPIVGGQDTMVHLTDRERALMDHAFKTGLSAAGGGGHVQPPELSKTSGTKSEHAEPLTLSPEEDVFSSLTAALLKDGDSASCSPANAPPPSPCASPLLGQKQVPDYNAIGDQLGDGWGMDDDPTMVDLYRSLDNIGESLFDEDTFELTFGFDSVDKPPPPCDLGDSTDLVDGRSGDGGVPQTSPPKTWDNPGRGESPFRRAAAKAAALMEQGLSPKRRTSQAHAQPPAEGRAMDTSLEEACARAAAAAAACHQSPAGAQTVQPPVQAMPAKPAMPIPPKPRELSPGPRVRQGFLRQLLQGEQDRDTRCPTPFSTVRGCLSEANAPPPPPPPPSPSPSSSAAVTSPATRPNSPSGRRAKGGENSAPRRGQPLSVALFAQTSWPSMSSRAGQGAGRKFFDGPTLKHGRAEVKVPPPQGSAAGSPLSSLPASRFN